jgi:MoaA/NifB/PqqE/SkfB family radical SAM enzyme
MTLPNAAVNRATGGWAIHNQKEDPRMPNPIQPRTIQIDSSSHCQLACRNCPTASRAIRPLVGAGHLQFANFQTLIERNPWLAEMELANWGEMFLNPRLVDMLQFAAERKISLHGDDGANLNFATEKTLEALVKYRLRSLTCALDGATPETYSQYRVRGNLERVIGHIESINRYRRAYSSGLPALTWQFVLFGHNQHEVELARVRAARLGMRFVVKLAWDGAFSPIRDAEAARLAARTRFVSRDEFRAATGINYKRSICYQLWSNPSINWDGRMLGCCHNYWGEFGGNAFTGDLLELVNGGRMRYARDMLMGCVPARDDIPCSACDLYRELRETGRWITDEELVPQLREPGILLSVVVKTGRTDLTHADIFVVSGSRLDPIQAVRPPVGERFTLGESFSVCCTLPRPGEYTICAIPRRIDPTFRAPNPRLPVVTRCFTAPARPVSQEETITID